MKIWTLLLSLSLLTPAYADPLQALSKKIRTDLKQKPVSLGVLNFTYERGQMSTGSYLVSERLLTYLVQNGATVVERRLLDSLLAEQRFSQIGVTNIDSLKRVGSVLGVDAVVVGTLSDKPNDKQTDVIARVINVETAEVMAASSITTPREWSDAPRSLVVARTLTPVPDVVTKERMPAIRLDPNEPKRVLGEYTLTPVPMFMPVSRILDGGTDQ